MAVKGARIGKIIAAAGVAAFMVMMLAAPSFYLDSARRGLSLYATSVLPSLFPFYFCSLLLTYIGAAKTVSGLLGKPMQLLYRAPKVSAYVLALSMLSGYPVGASMTAELYAAGVIDSKEAKCIASFASTSGPIFMLGTVGSAIFGDMRVGAVVLAAHYISALLNGLIYRMRKGGENTKTFVPPQEYDDLLSKTISTSTLNMLYVGGYIVLCGMLVDTLSLVGLNNVISAHLGDAAESMQALICGAIEMTRGCLAAAECTYRPLAVALAAGIVSLGGLSVTLQNFTFLSKCGMKAYEVAIRKTTQCILAFVVAFLLALVCKL